MTLTLQATNEALCINSSDISLTSVHVLSYSMNSLSMLHLHWHGSNGGAQLAQTDLANICQIKPHMLFCLKWWLEIVNLAIVT